ncbi:uncharacterized protein DUF3443 [Paraburkholderia caballeronis]|nr:uncharacterized protein DUF3443 [Paraburkholderia caballeronis]
MTDRGQRMQTHRTNPTFARWLRRAAFVVAAAVLGACGGGGGSDSGSTGNANSPNGDGGPSTQQPTAPNAVTVTVARGVQGVPNIPAVSVTVCVPGTSTCQIIGNVQVDTESSGLRLLASAMQSVAGALPAGHGDVSGTLAECEQFADGYTWGSIRSADVTIGGKTASAVPIQVIGDLPASTVPTDCQGAGPAENTQSDLGVNGILGIGVAPTDCAQCAQSTSMQLYYACPNGANCGDTTVPLAQQAANPAARFTTDNNGVILQLPAIDAGGAPSATGTLWFGIGTQTNNTLTATQRFATDGAGDFVANFNGARLVTFLDSGSNGLYFDDGALPLCGGNSGLQGFYCPSSPQTLGATLTGIDGATSASVSFNVGNAATLIHSGNFALDNLAGTLGLGALDLGLPFFYGRTVAYGFDQRASGGPAPFVAF